MQDVLFCVMLSVFSVVYSVTCTESEEIAEVKILVCVHIFFYRFSHFAAYLHHNSDSSARKKGTL